MGGIVNNNIVSEHYYWVVIIMGTFRNLVANDAVSTFITQAIR